MGLGLGLQGLLDAGVNKLVGGVFSGTAGFVSGMGRGLGRQASNAYSKAGIGKVTSALGHGIGYASSYVAQGLGMGGTMAGYGLYKGLSKSLPKDWAWLKKASYGAYKGLTREVPQELIDKGYHGLGGRIVKPGVALGISGGALALGAMKGAGDADYNIGIKYAVNVMMDTQGVGLTPGSVSPSFTPVYQRKPNNGLRDLGTDGNLGFALHNQRNTGQIRR